MFIYIYIYTSRVIFLFLLILFLLLKLGQYHTYIILTLGLFVALNAWREARHNKHISVLTSHVSSSRSMIAQGQTHVNKFLY